MTDKRVPREPAPEMLNVGEYEIMRSATARDQARSMWRAMYDAAPAVPDERDVRPMVFDPGNCPEDAVRHAQAERDSARAERDALKAALRKVLDTLDKEASAILTAKNAEENFSAPERELDAMQDAMVAASDAVREARAILAAPEDAP